MYQPPGLSRSKISRKMLRLRASGRWWMLKADITASSGTESDAGQSDEFMSNSTYRYRPAKRANTLSPSAIIKVEYSARMALALGYSVNTALDAAPVPAPRSRNVKASPA